MSLVRISDLIGSVVSNGNNLGGQVVSYMENLMNRMVRAYFWPVHGNMT